MSGKLTEKILLYRLQKKKDPEAYGKLYDTYVKRIYRFVYFKVSSHEEAEDITSEVFLKAWDYVKDDREIKNFGGLLYRIARNMIIDHYRMRAAKPEILSAEDETEIGDRNKWKKDFDVQAETKEIMQALKKLKQEYQEVITLRYVDELDLSEISEITGKGQVAVRVTLHRAVKKLKDLIEMETK